MKLLGDMLDEWRHKYYWTYGKKRRKKSNVFFLGKKGEKDGRRITNTGGIVQGSESKPNMGLPKNEH